jgi:pyrroline-5-carboxylate reductase
MVRLGFIGTGSIAAAIIEGLQASEGDRYQILVSPRSDEMSRALAARYPNVDRAESNAAVVEGSDVIFLTMRPRQLEEGIAGLAFRADQTVVSLVAGVARDVIAEKVRPATQVCRVIPLPPIRLRRGPVVIYPRCPLAEDLFRELGDLVIAGNESELSALGTASGVMSSYYEMQNAIIRWLDSRAVAPDLATHYVASLLGGLAAIGLDASQNGGIIDPADYETKGGLNERGRSYLRDAGWFDEVGWALDSIAAHRLVDKPEVPPSHSAAAPQE